MGTTLVGDPEIAIKGIEHLIKLSDGGFGGIRHGSERADGIRGRRVERGSCQPRARTP